MARQLHRGPSGSLVQLVRDRGPAAALVRVVSITGGTPNVTGLSLPGVSAMNPIVTPHMAAFPVSGGIDVRYKGTINDANPDTRRYFYKVDDAFVMSLTWDKRIRFQWRHGAGYANKTSTVGHTLTLGAVGTIRAVLRSDGGTGYQLLCYQSADWNPTTDTGTWTQIGTTLTGVESSTMVVGVGDLQLCYSATANSNPVTEVRYASVRPYLGAEIASFNPLTVASTGVRTPNTYTDAQGNAWTITGTTWSWLP